MGEVGRTARGQLLLPLMGTVRGWDFDPRVVRRHGRLLVRKRPELIVFRSSVTVALGGSGYQVWA